MKPPNNMICAIFHVMHSHGTLSKDVIVTSALSVQLHLFNPLTLSLLEFPSSDCLRFPVYVYSTEELSNITQQ